MVSTVPQQGFADASQAANLEDAALQQEDRPQRNMGRAVAAGRDRVPSQVRRGQGAASVLQGYPGGLMSWGKALIWGTVIVAVALAVLGAAYFLFQSFVFG
jgi:hypothetical protein